MSGQEALPLHIVSGFLGSGKTTLVNRLLRDPAVAGALVIVNEFGEVGLDHWLYERLDGEMALLSSGCVCCQLRGDLVDLLRDLLSRRDAGALPPFSRILIETSGLADPGPILHALIADPELARRLRLAGIVTVVDAVNGVATFHAHAEARRQLALADVVVITKQDLVPDLTPVRSHFEAINPGARLLERLDVRALLDAPPIAPASQRATRLSAHDGEPRAFAHCQREPVGEVELSRFFAVLERLAGPKLLRVKGLVRTSADRDGPLVVEGAQHLVHAPRRLAAWPFDPPETRLVAIAEGLTTAAIGSLWRALSSIPEIDRPDVAALVDNPLAPRAGGLFG